MACLYSVMLPWQRNTRQLKYQNTEVYLFILCYANFGDPGINGFGKIENATQVSKTVFSHLKYSYRGYSKKKCDVSSHNKDKATTLVPLKNCTKNKTTSVGVEME